MTKDEAINRIKELISSLNEASKAYYNDNMEIMPNITYDKLYDELKSLEEQYEIYFSNSPTQNVGYEISENLPKIKHEKPMLSLDKTKNRDELKNFLMGHDGVLSYKLDGLTVVLTYENGELSKGITRGNGETGELITNNVKNFLNVPIKIKFKGHLTIRGESLITYSDFKKINDEIYIEDEKYKNPRNLCSGSVRQLNPKITKERNVRFVAFALVDIEKTDDIDIERINETYMYQMEFLDKLGFETVERKLVNELNINDAVDWYAKDVVNNDYPSDGLVLIYNDIQYGLSLGMTSKFPRNAIAFKWKDELVKTHLIDIEWSPSRTGLINPVAIFDTVEIEGTNVSRASLHNISIIEELKLGIGDEITVYKANMIIPQIAENLTKSNKFEIPKKCPSCNKELEIVDNNGVKTLVCKNIDCPIKHIKNFENFVSRNCFNIEGISIATIEMLIEKGYIKEYADIFKLSKYRDEIIKIDGYGEKSFDNMIKAIEKCRNIECFRFINSLGISGIGTANAKIISKSFNNDIEDIRVKTEEDYVQIKDIGPVLAKSIVDFFNNKKNKIVIDNLLKEVNIVKNNNDNSNKLDKMIFVITGNLNEYKNRDELVKQIEGYGGKVTNSVSKNTTYLINNDINSNSTKNQAAKKFNIPIITEIEFKEIIK